MTQVISRRSMLRGTAAFGASSLLCAGYGTVAVSEDPAARRTDLTLRVQEVNGRPTYNGLSPGPTIVADPGDTIDVHLINDLPALHDDCADNHNTLHGLNTTNLHTHGLHVSPTTDSTGQFDSDNVFVSVVPKDQVVPCAELDGNGVKSFRWHQNRFRFEMGADHPSGTFWYHAHKHGSTFQQVAAGLAGPLVIRDRPGAMPEYISRASEKILMIMNRGLVLTNPAGGGTVDPTITLRPGEVQRWRIINAQAIGNSFAYLRTNVPGLEIYQIAFDGLTLHRRIKIDQGNDDEPWLNPAALAPGNRTDFIVRVPPDAKDSIFSIPVIREVREALGLSGAIASEIKIEIAGKPVNSAWSDDDTLPGPGLEPFAEAPRPRREIMFSPLFRIDGQAYDGKVKHNIPLGAKEEWTIYNDTGGVHAFHIHVNPIFITHINGIELSEDDPLRRWQDTVGLPYNDDGPGSITFRTRFETFTGKFVIHCHILRHEDLGMMQTVEVTG